MRRENETSAYIIFQYNSTGCRDQHDSPRNAKAPVSQDKNRGHFDSAFRSDQTHPQQGIHVVLVQERYLRRLVSFFFTVFIFALVEGSCGGLLRCAIQVLYDNN